jgi:biopolymer transport protein ExbB
LLWFILFLGIVSLAVFLERALHLHRARIDETDFLQGIFNIMRRGNIAEALALCEETPGPVARLASTAIKRRASSREMIKEELDHAGRSEISRMERRLSFLALATQIAPLLGLLGTTIGILGALFEMRAQGTVVLATDISNGLLLGAVTTAAGLLVAIQGFISFNVLVVGIDRLVLDMRHAASEIIFFLENLRETEKPHE